MANTMHYGNMEESDPQENHEKLIQKKREEILAAFPFVEPYIHLVEFKVIGMHSVQPDYFGLPPEILAMMLEAKQHK